MNWLPIETAPKDPDPGQHIAFWLPESGRVVMENYCWWLSVGQEWSTDDQPTHWMAIPEAPK